MTLFGKSTSTRTALLPRFAATALAVLAALTGSNWLMLLACACGALLVVSLVMKPNLDGLTLSVRMPARASVGASVECVVEVTNTGAGDSPVVHATHRVALFDDLSFRVDSLPPGGCAALTFARSAHARGVSDSSSVEYTSTAPLGLRQRKRTVDVPLRIIVHPAEVPVVLPPPPAHADSSEWVVTRSGHDVHGIREWRPGDDASQVHWRSSARRGRLVVLEREMPKPGGLALVLAGAPGAPDWESVVSTGAWTGVAAIRAGREVVLVSSIVGQSAPGPDDQTTLLDWCAQSQAALPPESQLRGAFDFAGRDGVVAVVAGESARGGWWQWASSLAEHSAISLVQLPLALPTAADLQ